MLVESIKNYHSCERVVTIEQDEMYADLRSTGRVGLNGLMVNLIGDIILNLGCLGSVGRHGRGPYIAGAHEAEWMCRMSMHGVGSEGGEVGRWGRGA